MSGYGEKPKRKRWWFGPEFPGERTTRVFIVLGAAAGVVSLVLTTVR